ncbi:MAG: TIGR00366 family protein [Flavobacteriales bacterium]|nr:TIGR00366 family protein [Flavobacteriales bacterium]
MSFAHSFEKAFRTLLPSPFTLAVILSFGVFAAAILLFRPADTSFLSHTTEVMQYWYSGIWNAPLLVFAYQMMLILVLGHVLALAPPIDALIKKLTKYCDTSSKAAGIVTATCVLLGLINWGLAIIFGAIFARKVGEYAVQRGLKINYPLIGACGYTGLLVWHGGISGSSTIKAAEEGHLASLVSGSTSIDLSSLPTAIGFGETVFSPMNLTVSAALLLILPFGAFILGEKIQNELPLISREKRPSTNSVALGLAERLDYHPAVSITLGIISILAATIIATNSITSGNGNFVNPNFINTVFFGLGLLAHGSISNFAAALDEAIGGAAGILIQFPLYFGILGIMKGAGIIGEISTFFVSISNQTTYPIFSFISAGFVNILVPSGGGQWMVQGPIIIEASQEMDLNLGKSIMAMAYGDQLTNMLQPFWALPLLSITGLKARDILPYTAYFMLIAAVIYTAGLLLF